METANDEVFAMAREAGLAGDVGATVVAALIHEDHLAWVSVGDSRLYLLRQGELHRITIDHSYDMHLAAMVRDGEISREEALSHPEKDALTSYIGIPELREVDLCEHPIPLESGDWIMVCSDGLYGSLDKEEIIPLLAGDPQQASDRLVQAVMAKDRKRQDNTTLAIIALMDE